MEASALQGRGRIHLPLSRGLLAPLGDEALVQQVRNGNERAFEVLYDRYHHGLLSFCRHMLGSTEEAEDALQQTFVSAYSDLHRSSRPIALKAWLYTIARNRCLSVLRARREQTSEVLEPATVGLADEVEQRLELRQLLADLAELPEQQRAALVLAEIDDLSHADIGAVLGCEASKVKSLIFQARSALMEARRAREIPCAEIREQLATLRGGALRRSGLRRHVKSCPGCSEFRQEVRRQRALMAVVLPVLPSVGLKRGVLATVGIGSGGVTGGGLAAGIVGKSVLTKLAVAAAAGGAAVGGVAVEEHGSLPFVTGHGSEQGSARAGSEQAPLAPSSAAPGQASGAAQVRSAAPGHGRGSDRHVTSVSGRSRGFQPLQGQSTGDGARNFTLSRGGGDKLGVVRQRPQHGGTTGTPSPTGKSDSSAGQSEAHRYTPTQPEPPLSPPRTEVVQETPASADPTTP
jgi:RNA polymerase sigma factor (sigma-70 family)